MLFRVVTFYRNTDDDPFDTVEFDKFADAIAHADEESKWENTKYSMVYDITTGNEVMKVDGDFWDGV